MSITSDKSIQLYKMLKGYMSPDPDNGVVHLYNLFYGRILGKPAYFDDVTIAIMTRAIYDNYEFAKWCKDNVSDEYWSVHIAISDRFIMSNDLSYVHNNLCCIWYPDKALESTYRNLYNMNIEFRYHVAKAAIIHGYCELFFELGVDYDKSLMIDAINCNNIHIVKYLLGRPVLDILDRPYSYKFMKNTYDEPVTQSYPTMELVEDDSIEDMYNKVRLAYQYKRSLLYNMLIGLTNPNKYVMCYYAHTSNLSKYCFDFNPTPREIFCIERGVLHSYEFAKMCKDIIPCIYTTIHDAISSRFIMSNDLTYLRTTVTCICFPNCPSRETCHDLLKLGVIDHNVIVMASINVYSDLYKSMTPSIYMLKEAMDSGHMDVVEDIITCIDVSDYDKQVTTSKVVARKYAFERPITHDGLEISVRDIYYEFDLPDPLDTLLVTPRIVNAKLADIDTLTNLNVD